VDQAARIRNDFEAGTAAGGGRDLLHPGVRPRRTQDRGLVELDENRALVQTEKLWVFSPNRKAFYGAWAGGRGLATSGNGAQPHKRKTMPTE